MTIAVGSTYSGENLPEKEGPVFEFTKTQQNLILKLNGISEQEIASFQKAESVELALFFASDVLFLLVRVAGVIDWSDAPYSVVTFSPELWPDKKALELPLTMIFVEGSNKRVMAVRQVRLESGFREALYGQIEIQKRSPIGADKFLRQISTVQKKNTPAKMLKQAIATVSA
ncbi:MAG: hypothetical protein A2X94_02855 [Bdellovibrionales bacterium GWB1_55_8]|nr:MAG: hypothetical protein A2X94_02855 [Bdellovibrionales bacterium GWB1_55_8]